MSWYIAGNAEPSRSPSGAFGFLGSLFLGCFGFSLTRSWSPKPASKWSARSLPSFARRQRTHTEARSPRQSVPRGDRGMYEPIPRGSTGQPKRPWLERLRADGVYLVDLVPFPVDKLTSGERRRARREHVTALVEQARALDPARGHRLPCADVRGGRPGAPRGRPAVAARRPLAVPAGEHTRPVCGGGPGCASWFRPSALTPDPCQANTPSEESPSTQVSGDPRSVRLRARRPRPRAMQQRA